MVKLYRSFRSCQNHPKNNVGIDEKENVSFFTDFGPKIERQ